MILFLVRGGQSTLVYPDIKLKLVDELIPKLSKVREDRESEFRKYNKDSSEEHMEEFFDKMNILLEEFEGNDAIINAIESEVNHAKNWTSENDFDQADERPERVLDSKDETTTITTTRSIFDDIDS